MFRRPHGKASRRAAGKKQRRNCKALELPACVQFFDNFLQPFKLLLVRAFRAIPRCAFWRCRHGTALYCDPISNQKMADGPTSARAMKVRLSVPSYEFLRPGIAAVYCLSLPKACPKLPGGPEIFHGCLNRPRRPDLLHPDSLMMRQWEPLFYYRCCSLL